MTSTRRGAPFALLALALVGCVERTLEIRSDPPGAKAYLDDEPVGVTPVTVPFSFYGTREVRLARDGYRPHRALVTLNPPVYEWFPLDFLFENLLPFTLRDAHVHEAVLDPRPSGEAAAREEEEFLRRAEEARKAGEPAR